MLIDVSMGDPDVLLDFPAAISLEDSPDSPDNTDLAADPHAELNSKAALSICKETLSESSATVVHDTDRTKHAALHSARSVVMETPTFTKPYSTGSAPPKEHWLPKLNLSSKVDVEPFSRSRMLAEGTGSFDVGAHSDEHAPDLPPVAVSPNTKAQLPECGVPEQSKEDPPLIVRQPLIMTPGFDGKDPLAEVLDWLGHSDIGLNQLPPDAANNSLIDEVRAQSFDFVALEDDGTSARAQIPREWPPKQSRQHLQMLSQCPVVSAVCVEDTKKVSGERLPSERYNALLAEDEEEWLQRQQRTGTVGRLVIYAATENPQEDVVLRGGSGRPLIVTSVSECGPASRAGIKAGDRLASINGKKHFTGLSADAVRAQLFHPPLMLVFLGFVGKLQAEVRLTSATGICGMPLRRDVLRGNKNAPIEVCDQTIFHAAAPLFLTVREETESMVEGLGALFELQRLEAASIVQNALVHAMHDGPIPLPATPIVSRANTLTRESSVPTTRAGPYAQEEPQKPGGDTGAVEDALERERTEQLQAVVEETTQELRQQKEAGEEETKEAKLPLTTQHEDEEEEDDMLRRDHHIPRIPGMMFPATDRVIGAGLTPRIKMFDRPQTTRTLAQSFGGPRASASKPSGPRASKPLVPCVVDPDACRLERFCA